MEEDDALSSLQTRLNVTTLSQRSRASRTPIDATPESFMGASVGAKSGDEESDTSAPIKPPELKGTSRRAVARDAEPTGEDQVHRRKGRRRGHGATGAIDPHLLSQMMAGEGAGALPKSILEGGVAPTAEDANVAQMEVAGAKQEEEEAKPEETNIMEAEPVSAVKSPSPIAESPIVQAIVSEEMNLAVQVPSAEETESIAQESTPREGAPMVSSGDDLQQREPQSAKDLEDYHELCKSLELDLGAAALARYIGKLQGVGEDHEALKVEYASLQDVVQRLRGELDEQKAANEQLIANMASTGAAGSPSKQGGEEEEEKIAQLEELCTAKDQEIGELKIKLAASMAATGITPAEGLEEEGDGEIVAQAERELQLMDELIREQEEFLRELEKEMEAEPSPSKEAGVNVKDAPKDNLVQVPQETPNKPREGTDASAP